MSGVLGHLLNRLQSVLNAAGLYCTFFIAHALNGRISTFSQKFDVTVVFIDPDFLKYANISAIRP